MFFVTTRPYVTSQLNQVLKDDINLNYIFTLAVGKYVHVPLTNDICYVYVTYGFCDFWQTEFVTVSCMLLLCK